MQKLKKIRTGPVQKKLFRPAGIPAGKESSTGPDRTGPAGYRYRLQLWRVLLIIGNRDCERKTLSFPHFF